MLNSASIDHARHAWNGRPVQDEPSRRRSSREYALHDESRVCYDAHPDIRRPRDGGVAMGADDPR